MTLEKTFCTCCKTNINSLEFSNQICNTCSDAIENSPKLILNEWRKQYDLKVKTESEFPVVNYKQLYLYGVFA